MRFLSVLLFIALIFTSCSRESPSGPKSDPAIGKTKEEISVELQSQDAFQGIQTSLVDSEYEQTIRGGDETYIFQDGRVISKIRNARKEERALIYWREKFKGKLYRERTLKNQKAVHGHQKAWLEFACDSAGTGVIFDPVREQVVKVFYYARHE